MNFQKKSKSALAFHDHYFVSIFNRVSRVKVTISINGVVFFVSKKLIFFKFRVPGLGKDDYWKMYRILKIEHFPLINNRDIF